jgi:hypothetical protein
MLSFSAYPERARRWWYCKLCGILMLHRLDTWEDSDNRVRQAGFAPLKFAAQKHTFSVWIFSHSAIRFLFQIAIFWQCNFKTSRETLMVQWCISLSYLFLQELFGIHCIDKVMIFHTRHLLLTTLGIGTSCVSLCCSDVERCAFWWLTIVCVQVMFTGLMCTEHYSITSLFGQL